MGARRRGRRRRAPQDVETDASWGRRAEIALTFVTLFGVLAIGAVHTRTLFALAVASGLAAACSAKSCPGTRPNLPVVACLGLAGWCVLQTVPLPISALRTLSPATADVWSRALEPMGATPPTWASISLDPGASLREACRYCTYGCVMFSASIVARRRGGSDYGALLLFGAGITVAVSTVLHGVSGVTDVWGIYRPRFRVQPWHVGPLLNPNNLAGYLNLSFFAGLGLIFSERYGKRHLAIGLGLMVLAAVSVLSASRGGVLLLPIGTVAVVAVLWRRGRLRRPARAMGVVSLAAAAAIALALMGGSATAWAELLNTSLEKLSLNHWMAGILGEYAWLGIGRGAFESVSPAFQPPSAHLRFTHAEMFPLHWAIEWGVGATVVALLTFGFVLWPRRLKTLDRTSGVGLYAGVVVILVQNLSDLALEIPGVVVALSVALGTLCPAQRPARGLRGRTVVRAWVPVVALASTLLLALVFGERDLERDRDELQAIARRVVTAEGNVSIFDDSLREAIRRHPAEPYFPLLAALVAHERGDRPAMPWIQLALERGEANGRIHLLVAYVLARHGAKNQALMELRLAMERDTLLREPAAELALSLTQDTDELMRAVPDGPRGVFVLDAMSRRLAASGRPLDREILARDSGHVEARLRLALALVDDLEESRCADAGKCMAEVALHIAMLQDVAPRRSASVRAAAALRLQQGDALGAAKLLAEACDGMRDRLPCWHAGLEAAAETDDVELVATVAEKLMAESCADRTRCASTAERLGHLYRDRGLWPVAMVYYQRAWTEDETLERLLLYARAAKQAGATTKARVALQRALPRYPEQASRIRKQLLELSP